MVFEILEDLKDSNLHFSWHNVSVRGYDAEKQQWHVTPDDREHYVFDMYRPDKRTRQPEAIEEKRQSTDNGTTNGHNGYEEHTRHHENGTHGDYDIPRIQLCFLAEDPRIFADRVAKAYHDRKRTEAELRSVLFIDCMPTDGIGKLDDERVKRMVELTRTSATSKTL